MRGVNLGEVWMADFGMAAKVRPALLLTGRTGCRRARPRYSFTAHNFAARQPLRIEHS